MHHAQEFLAQYLTILATEHSNTNVTEEITEKCSKSSIWNAFSVRLHSRFKNKTVWHLFKSFSTDVAPRKYPKEAVNTAGDKVHLIYSRSATSWKKKS